MNFIGELPEKLAARRLPKTAMNLSEVVFAIGSAQVVQKMRDQGMLRPASTRPLLFDSGDVARAWTDWREQHAAIRNQSTE